GARPPLGGEVRVRRLPAGPARPGAAAGTAPRAGGPLRMPARLPPPVTLFLAAAVISGITALDGIQPNDEGLMLQAAARIADGQVPYSDFWWFYPPGQPLLLAGLWELFGPSLVPWRVLRVLCDATVAVL